jgi:predicted DNA-binding protein (UPF0251 family)
MATPPASAKAKPAAAKPAKPAAAAKPAKEKGAGADAIRVKDLVETIAPNVSVKRPDIKATLEAALKAMADALTAGKVLNLPPLGKITVKRSSSNDNADMAVLKLRRAKVGAGAKPRAAKPAGKGKPALADDDE